MYGYQPEVASDIRVILHNYNQEEIFRIPLGHYPRLGEYITSPFREDSNAGCRFEWYGDKLFFVDFGDIITHRDCFNFLRDFYGFKSISQISEFIVSYFDDTVNYPQGLTTESCCRPHIKKEHCSILFHSKPFIEADRLHWSQFEIKKAHLIEDSVFSLSMYKIYTPEKDKWTTFRPIDLSYAICGFDERCKIYNPYKKGKFKWITNCVANDVGGFSNLTFGSVLIITKSYKDYRVLKNQGYHVVWFQNEGMFPSDEILLNIAGRYDNIYILFDNDTSGIQAALKLQDKYAGLGKEVKSFTSPYSYLKDPAEIISVKGNQILNKFLWDNCH